MHEKTIFEKIIDREIPADIIYEDDIYFVLLDINPVRKGHLLLISKKPYPWISDVPDETIATMFIATKKFINLLKQQFSCDYVHVVVEGIQVPHFHIHLIPSMVQKENAQWHHESYTDQEERDYYINKIKSAL